VVVGLSSPGHLREEDRLRALTRVQHPATTHIVGYFTTFVVATSRIEGERLASPQVYLDSLVGALGET
jgi:hypothetical protein